MNVNRWRWWLARRVAPEAILGDPFPASEAVVIYRRDGVRVAQSLDQFRLRTVRQPLHDFQGLDVGGFPPLRRSTYFVGRRTA